MTKKEHQYLDDLEKCFEQLKYDYESSQNRVKELEAKVEILKKLCQENFIEIPQLDEPF